MAGRTTFLFKMSVLQKITGAAAATVLTPGPHMSLAVIQNNGANPARLTLDGGSTYTDGVSGGTGTDPTATTGFLLPVNGSYTINRAVALRGIDFPSLVVRAIQVTGPTTLDIVTDDTKSS